MASKTSVSNLSLSHLGISKMLQNIDTDRSAEGAACRDFWEVTTEEAFRDMSPPFATEFATLGLIEEDPTDEWAYSYRYPSDCKFFRRILSGTRNDSRQSKIPYKIGRDDQGLIVYTDQRNAECEYTIVEDNVERWPSDFVMCVSLLLAAYIAPRVTAGDPFKLGTRAFELYLKSKAKAAGNAFNEQQEEEPPQSEFIRGRD